LHDNTLSISDNDDKAFFEPPDKSEKSKTENFIEELPQFIDIIFKWLRGIFIANKRQIN
jgi:hypothetical protein